VRASVFVATSLDGFMAREDGDIAWLTAGGPDEPGEDYGYAEFMQTVDVLVMGRGTFEKTLGFDPWPFQKPVVVRTRRPLRVPDSVTGPVEAMAGSPAEMVARLAERGAQHLYVDGGVTITEFLAAGLIQRIILTRIPILLGRGIPLFGPLAGELRLRHLTTRSFSSGLVQSTYEVEP
jgi:dihydrofolate reductase